MPTDIVKVFVPATLAFTLGILCAPILAHYLYAFRAWKKTPGKGKGLGGGGTPIFDELHRVRETSTPRMGGVLIWASVLFTILGVSLLAFITFPHPFFQKLEFFSRDQTWIPLMTLIVGGIVGFIDDLLEVRALPQEGEKKKLGGLSLSKRLIIVGLLALFVAWWFSFKLGVTAIGLPIIGAFSLGIFFIPFFIAVVLLLYASGTIDGIDGLSGGVFAIIFAAYAVLAFSQDQINLAAFAAAVSGATLAFLWFNIPPARFYMSETGSMALTITLAVIAFLTDMRGEGSGIMVLPVIAFPLFITVAGTVLQVTSKKIFGKKIFHVAPIHHHFESIGWPPYKVTMRYWVITMMSAIIGLTIALIVS